MNRLAAVVRDGFEFFYLRTPDVARATEPETGAAGARPAGRPHASGSPDSHRIGAPVGVGESGP